MPHTPTHVETEEEALRQRFEAALEQAQRREQPPPAAQPTAPPTQPAAGGDFLEPVRDIATATGGAIADVGRLFGRGLQAGAEGVGGLFGGGEAIAPVAEAIAETPTIQNLRFVEKGGGAALSAAQQNLLADVTLNRAGARPDLTLLGGEGTFEERVNRFTDALNLLPGQQGLNEAAALAALPGGGIIGPGGVVGRGGLSAAARLAIREPVRLAAERGRNIGRLPAGLQPGQVPDIRIPGSGQTARVSGEGILRPPQLTGGAEPGVIPVVSRAETTARAVNAAHPETQRSLAQAAVMVRQDAPGAASRFFDHVPGIRQLRRAERPGLDLPENLLTAHVAERSASAEIATRAFSTRQPLIQQIDVVFGRDVSRGGAAGVRFLGTSQQARNPITGTFKDIVDNPELYELSTPQRQLIQAFERRNDEFLNFVNQGYGSDISRFQAKPGGAFLPNVDRGAEAEAIREAIGASPIRVVSRGTQRSRVFQTARDRMTADPKFKPETNIRVLVHGIDEAKGFAASSQVFRTGLGGRTEGQLLQEFGTTKGWTFVGDGIDLWFPAAEAGQIQTLRRSAMGGFLDVIDKLRGTAFTADFSPITGVQAPLSFLGDPRGATAQWLGGLTRSVKQRDVFAAFKEGPLAKDIAADPQGWSDFAFYMGRPIVGGRPEEMAKSFLEQIPKVGAFVKGGNEAMFIGIMRRAKRMYDGFVDDSIGSGASAADAKAAAADMATKIIPLINPSRLGQSQFRAQLARVPFTSISFLRKPAELSLDAARGYAKMLTRQKVTLRERLATKTALRIAATIQTLSTTTAVFAAHQQGTDKEQAIKDTLPGGRYFMEVVFPNGDSIPIGGPFRSLARAIMPGEVEGIPFPVPFAGIVSFFEGKLTPAIGTQLDLLRNKDFFGNRIRMGGLPEQLLRLVAYEAEGLLPLTAGEVAGGIRTGETPGDIGTNVVSQFSGSPNLQRNSVLNEEAQEMFPGNNFADIEEPYQRDLITGSERIAPDLKRNRERNQRLRPDSIQALFAHFDDIDEQLFNDLVALGENRGKTIDGISYTRRYITDQYFALQSAVRNQKLGVQRAFPDFEFEPSDVNDPDPNRAALAQWFAVLDDPSVNLGNGAFNTDQLTVLRQALLRGWRDTPEIEQYVLRNTNRREVPLAVLAVLPRVTRTRYEASRQARLAHMRKLGL